MKKIEKMLFNEKTNKNSKIEIRVSAEEKEKIKEIAKQKKLNLSDFIKLCVNEFLKNN